MKYQYVYYEKKWWVFKGDALLDPSTEWVCACDAEDRAEQIAELLNRYYKGAI